MHGLVSLCISNRKLSFRELTPVNTHRHVFHIHICLFVQLSNNLSMEASELWKEPAMDQKKVETIRHFINNCISGRTVLDINTDRHKEK